MVCLILTSCTAGNNTIIITNPTQSPTLVPYVGFHVPIVGYPGICFSVESVEIVNCPCTVTQQTPVEIDKTNLSKTNVIGQNLCGCTVPFTCYILTPCDPALPTFYTEQNLNPYVNQTITFFGQGGTCYTVTGSINIPSGIDVVAVECIATCQCNIPVCGCPEGFTLNENGECVGLLNTPPVLNQTTYIAGPADNSICYWGVKGATFYPNITNNTFPIVASGGNVSGVCAPLSPPSATITTLTDSSSNILIPTNTVINNVWGWVYDSGRLATVGISTVPVTAALNQWIGFTFCETLITTKTYYVGLAGDDSYRFYINGQLVIDHSSAGFGFVDWKIFPITLNAGINIFDTRVYNTGGPTGLGFEVYDATLAELLAVTTANSTPGPTDLNQYIIFSTIDKIGQTWEIGETSGYTCPNGYSLNTCDGIVCSQIATIPQTPCFAWQITFCDGTGLEPIITSTDLTLYVGGVYTICYYDGETSICGCGSVTQIDAQEAPAFTGTFSEIAYDCCEKCMQVCYLLTDCQGAVDPIITCTDLSNYVNQIVKLSNCGNICWIVSTSETCDGSILLGTVLEEFVTCEHCLPPPPLPPVFDLHPRRIKPGYFSTNSCITTEYMERVNCNFAKQVYDDMLIRRYGITVCCDHDVNSWDIKKQVLDLELLGDPSLCKSTICYCLAPCLIDVIFTLTPVCLAPALIDATFDNLCYPPEVVDVTICAQTTELPCNCYILVGTSYTVDWLDCCGDFQSDTFTNNSTICAHYIPVIRSGSVVITSGGDCGSESCVAPPPICRCYNVIPKKAGSVVSYDTCNGIPVTVTSLAVPIDNTGVVVPYSMCSSSVPVAVFPTSVNSITPTGFCNVECGLTSICYCYQIVVTSTNLEPATIQVNTNACDGVIPPNVITSTVTSGTDLYICSKRFPVVTSASSNASINIRIRSTLNCLTGDCVAP